MASSKVLILVDADVLIHLFKADKISILNELYPKRLRMLDIVVNELRSNRTINAALDAIFLFSGIIEIPFPTSTNIKLLQEYVDLLKTINGKGECATLIYCKHNNQIIASSNTKDIVPYCKSNAIEYLTTLDIFCIAIHKGLMKSAEANKLINVIKSKDSYLCCDTIEQHAKKHFDTKKLLF